jgi:hypothetical protein
MSEAEKVFVVAKRFGKTREDRPQKSRLGRAYLANREVNDLSAPLGDTKVKSEGVAAGVHGLTGSAFQRIPYTPDQVAVMEAKGQERVATLQQELAPVRGRIDSLQHSIQTSRYEHGELNHERKQLERVVHAFERVPNSGVTERQYNEAKSGIAVVDQKLQRVIQIEEDYGREMDRLAASVENRTSGLRKELMEDPTVRYTEQRGATLWRQHIDVDGNMGGMVADGADVSPGAFVDMESRVSGKGLVVPDGVQIVNSDVSLSYTGPTQMDPRTGKLMPMRGYFVPQSATLDESVSDSIVRWEHVRGTVKKNGMKSIPSATKIVRKKPNVEP